jgi:hypothetical protein
MSPLNMSRGRYEITMNDLRWAQKFASHILKKGLHGRGGEQTELIHRALNLSMIVSYCRPFGKNQEKEGQDLVDSPLYDLVRTVLTKDEFRLHKLIVKARNNVYAHSAASAHFFGLSEPKGKTIVVTRDVLEPLAVEDTTVLHGMIKKWIEYLKQRRSEVV